MGIFQGRPVDNTILAFIPEEGDYPAINSGIKVGDEIINFDDIYETIQSGEKYSRVRSLGFVEYPAQNIYQIIRVYLINMLIF